MRRLVLAVMLFVVSVWMVSSGKAFGAAVPKTPVREIGSRLELFVDDWLIGEMRGATLKMHSPVPREVVLRFDTLWETSQSGYVAVMKDGGRFRMYYRAGGDQSREYACLAESNDGVLWTRPSFGLVEFNGSKSNNILLQAQRRSYGETHNFAPFRDENPAARADQRYKAVGLGWAKDAKGQNQRALLAFASPDGIRWTRMQEAPVMTQGAFDSQNTAFWDPALRTYVCYLRVGREGKRSVSRCTSPDFLHWSEPVYLDFGPTPLEQFYTNAITPYFRAPHIFLGLPMRFVPERKRIGADGREVDGLSDAVLISSHDGLRWSRSFMEAFIRPGPDRENWGSAHGNNTPAWGIVPTGEEELSVYWCEHYNTVPQMRRGTLRLDGFASVNAPYAGGEMITKPLSFQGDSLVLNYATSAVGSVRVEVQDANGKAVKGFSLADCSEIYGDELQRAVSWKGNPNLGALAGRPIRLRFALKDADLYSIRFESKTASR